MLGRNQRGWQGAQDFTMLSACAAHGKVTSQAFAYVSKKHPPQHATPPALAPHVSPGDSKVPRGREQVLCLFPGAR